MVHIADDRPGHHQLLIRRNRRTGELAFCRCYSPTAVPLSTLVRVAGRRWAVEETFQSGKGLTGPDQVRRWTSWHRWVTLAMLAHAFLAVATADERTHRPASDGLIPLTRNEIAHLFNSLVVQPAHTAVHRAGPTGDGTTRPESTTATTCDKQRFNRDHDLQLPYSLPRNHCSRDLLQVTCETHRVRHPLSYSSRDAK